MKKYLLILILSAANLLAQTAGSSGLSFLKLGFGARNIAMGDLGVAAVDDLTALNYNPAQLSIMPKSQLSFSHNSLFQDLNSEMIGASFSLFDLPLAFGVNTTNVNDIEVRYQPGEAVSKFNAHYFAATLSAAHKIIEDFYGGITVKYLYENLFTDDATGFAFDFGVNYKGIIDGLTLGASFRNIGSMKVLKNESTVLPKDLRAGAAYSFPIPELKFDITALGGMQKYLDTDETHLHFGGEVLYNKLFAVRVGYMSGYDSKSLTTGFGLLWKGLNLDYAYVPVKYGLGDSHIISFIYSFD